MNKFFLWSVFLLVFYSVSSMNNNNMPPAQSHPTSLKQLCLAKIIDFIETGIYKKNELKKNNRLPLLLDVFDEMTKNQPLDTIELFHYVPLANPGHIVSISNDNQLFMIQPLWERKKIIIDKNNHHHPDVNLQEQFPPDTKKILLKKYGKNYLWWPEPYLDLPENCCLSSKGMIKYKLGKCAYFDDQLQYTCLKEPYCVIVAHKKNEYPKVTTVFLCDLSEPIYPNTWLFTGSRHLVANGDNYFAITGTHEVMLGDLKKLSAKGTLSTLSHPTKVKVAAFDSSGLYIITATTEPNNSLYLWHTTTKECLKIWQFWCTIEPISWSPSSLSLLIGLDARRIYELRDPYGLIKALPFIRYKKVLEALEKD